MESHITLIIFAITIINIIFIISKLLHLKILNIIKLLL